MKWSISISFRFRIERIL